MLIAIIALASTAIASLPLLVNGTLDADAFFIILRQCRWAPHTARNQNGAKRRIGLLGTERLSQLFEFDEESDWTGFTENPTKLKTDYVLPKWIFRNAGVQALIAVILVVDRINMETQISTSVFYITPWNMMLCGVYKFHEGLNLHDLIITNGLGSEDKLADLLDLLLQLGLCLVNEMMEFCPSECHAENPFVVPCNQRTNTQPDPTTNCFTKISEEDEEHKPFNNKELETIDMNDFNQEMVQFRDWHSAIPESKRIPIEIFEENQQNHKLVRFAITELLAHDPDEKPVELDDHFRALQRRYEKSGCDTDDTNVQQDKKCLQFRIQLHLKLVVLQKQLVAFRLCRCNMGFKWDTETDSCAKRLLGYCHEEEVCENGGECSSQVIQLNAPSSTKTKAFSTGSALTVRCTCPPAWTGRKCEVENDICQVLPSNSTCGDHVCQRDPNNFQIGFNCVCPPDTYKPISAKNPRCRDINECTERNPPNDPICKNDGDCENHDPGYICNCKHGYSGARCEFPPSTPFWSEWEEWSKCILPDKALACQESPMQVRIRRCNVTGLAQHCEGPRREIRFLCPAEMNNWDTVECQKLRSSLPPGIQVKYSALDYAATEEYGKFSAHEVEIVVEDRLNVYLWHYWLLLLTLIGCLITPVAAGWCFWHVMRVLAASRRFRASKLGVEMAKQQAASRTEAEVEANAYRARAEEERMRARANRAAAKEATAKAREARAAEKAAAKAVKDEKLAKEAEAIRAAKDAPAKEVGSGGQKRGARVKFRQEGVEKTPDRKEKTPDRKEKTPDRKEKTPDGKEKTPDGKEKTPDGKEKTPDRKEKTPDRKEKTPDNKEKTPV